jgi:Protein of unknown function (DUF2786)
MLYVRFSRRHHGAGFAFGEAKMNDVNDPALAKVVAQIQAIMARTQQAGFTEAEADQANEKVTSLLAKYNLDREAVRAKGTDTNDDPMTIDDSNITELSPWFMFLGSGLSRMCCCAYYRTRVVVTGKQGKFVQKGAHVFVGTKANTTVAAMMFNYLSRTVERLAREGARGLPEKDKSPYRVTFRRACAAKLDMRMTERVRQAMKGELPEVNDAGEKTGRNLPALLSLYERQKAAISDFMEKQGVKPKTKKLPMESLSDQGRADGLKAGESISLDMQISKSTKSAGAIADTKQIAHKR